MLSQVCSDSGSELSRDMRFDSDSHWTVAMDVVGACSSFDLAAGAGE